MKTGKARLSQRLCGVLTDRELQLLPGGWQILGDVILVSLHPLLYPRRREVGAALLDLYPRCTRVLLYEGVRGRLREPRTELIATRGGGGGETVFRENGCVFKIDLTRLMHSQGNLAERIRMSRLGRGENVVDMFAGIGYFTVPMAVHAKPASITAIEINPVAYRYLLENIRLNRVESIVMPVLGDCRLKTPVGIADRVVMGYIGDTHNYLEVGIRALKTGGVLHYHEAVPVAVPWRPEERIKNAAKVEGRSVEFLERRRVKKYAPGVEHVVVDARIY